MHKAKAVTFSTGKIHSAFAALDKNKCGKQLNRFFFLCFADRASQYSLSN